jgi:hypothetical protein
MWITFTNRDSDGNPVTSRLTAQHDGERVEIDVTSTGRVQVPEDLATDLIASDDYAIEAADDVDADDPDGADADSDSDSDSVSD